MIAMFSTSTLEQQVHLAPIYLQDLGKLRYNHFLLVILNFYEGFSVVSNIIFCALFASFSYCGYVVMLKAFYL